ncbi:MAG: hypothetical protein F4W95_05975 [Chloroflexi bacterium]|nr:hypothetical protein [Chloroflexota bacterium]MYD48016.1 hypothetical protein [Chloroflexota bacterium]
MLGTLYTQSSNYTYAAIVTAKPDTAQSGDVPTDNKAVYISSARLGDREIVYGSLLHTIDEAIRPIYQSSRRLREMSEIIPADVFPSVEYTESGDGIGLYTLPPGDYSDAIIHQQEQILKDTLLLSGIHVRTLLEDFSGRGNVPVPIYDYESEPAGSVSLAEIFNTLEHYRYCVVSGEFVHDVFSSKGQLGSDQLVGSKMKIHELFNAIFVFISRIRIKDFAGVLRARLENLSVDSDRSDAIFAVQNVHSIAQIMHERTVVVGTLPEFIAVLNRKLELTTKERRILQDAEDKGETEVHLVRIGGLPVFSIGRLLHNKMIETHITINGESEKVEISWDEFFRELVKVHGDEPLVPREVLEKRFEHLDAVGR